MRSGGMAGSVVRPGGTMARPDVEARTIRRLGVLAAAGLLGWLLWMAADRPQPRLRVDALPDPSGRESGAGTAGREAAESRVDGTEDWTGASRRSPAGESTDPAPRPTERAETLARAVREARSPEERDRLARELMGRLAGEDPSGVRIALEALQLLWDCEFDRSLARADLLRLLGSEEPGIRAGALLVFAGIPREEGDAAIALSLAGDPSPEVRGRVAGAARAILRGDLRAAHVDPAMETLLGDPEPSVIRSTLVSLTECRFGPRTELRLLDLLRNPGMRLEVVRMALGTCAERSPAVMEALVANLREGDPELQGALLWVLRSGEIPSSHRRSLADAALALVRGGADWNLRTEALSIVRLHGDASHLPELESIRIDAEMPAQLRMRATEAIRAIRERGH